MFQTIEEITLVARGISLRNSLEQAMNAVNHADPRVGDLVELNLADLLTEILPKLHNMTNDGRAQWGRSLQAESRKLVDTDMGRGYALWLAGAWLEAGQISSPDARYVSAAIAGLVQSIDLENVRATVERL